MAAGLGSRYGGDKQVQGFGPNNEILMDYAVFDGIRAGFNRFYFVIRPDLEELFNRLLADKLKGVLGTDGEPIEYYTLYQDDRTIPDWYRMPEERVKPLGTVHAVLAAAETVCDPFAVINADDFYGYAPLKALHDELVKLPERGRGIMIAYRLENTISANGTVNRGICRLESGNLISVTETYGIHKCEDELLRSEDGTELDPKSPVSMNIWGFTPWLFEKMREYFYSFLRELSPDECKKECILPDMVEAFLSTGELTVSAVETHGEWFGVTVKADSPIVRDRLKQLHDSGSYPPSLWKEE